MQSCVSNLTYYTYSYDTVTQNNNLPALTVIMFTSCVFCVIQDLFHVHYLITWPCKAFGNTSSKGKRLFTPAHTSDPSKFLISKRCLPLRFHLAALDVKSKTLDGRCERKGEEHISFCNVLCTDMILQAFVRSLRYQVACLLKGKRT